jgi:hypothetical protein
MWDLHYDDAEHRYWDSQGDVISVTQALAEAGIIQKSKYRPGSAEKGKSLHLLFQLYDEGTLDWGSLPEGSEGYLEQYSLAMKELGGKVTSQEVMIGHEKYRYGGHCDKVIEGCMIGEIKTGREEPWHDLQLAAYREAFNDWFSASIGGCVIIYVHSDDHRIVAGMESFKYFIHVLGIAGWKKSVSKSSS